MTIITKSNFKDVLRILGFIENGNIFEKKFAAFNCSLSVDFANEKLIYPVEIKGRERNDDFKQPENFVVFECVNRLLEKGYRPEHIELEKEWHLGHDAKGGRADVCVSAPDGSMLFIVECKTAGKEFDKAYKDTCVDGAQLFSYWQQERATKWLVLYASGIDEESITYKAPTISCSDDPNIVIGAKKDNTIKLYTSAYTAEEKHLVWRDTYANFWFDDLVFSADSRAYNIGIKPLLKKDLRDFTPDDKIVNKFEEILRHNNVSDKENAFNRLVALFICKLVDEIQKSDTDEVEFQYKQGTDTYETLQDRLQRLHKEGMETFMREEIFYVSADYPEWLFSNYTGHQRKKAIEDLKDKIRILKFFSNNDFSFKDVHNEELFYQNGKILVEVVQLFEKYRIVYPSKHQFLGDLFEQLLNKGFKQNEGQFFTPMPITRFIWDCLPLEQITHSEKGTIYPKVIDYACGAGHFLTEAVEAINAFVDSDENNAWVRDHIFGIEKDYRLARVSKISMFMNGAGEANIIFGDGLENQVEKGIENEAFDILVANPPYSVKDFKQHLKLKNNSFELMDRIGDNGKEIEVLFVERISQLLKPKGVAAVVLPVGLLSGDSSCYIGAREQILENFNIRAIVQFGGDTFGATDMKTVVLFLQKFDEPPKRKNILVDSVEAIMSGEKLIDWEDIEIFNSYIETIGTAIEDYESFVKENFSINELYENEYFKMYIDDFESSSDIKKFKASKSFSKLSEEQQKHEIKRRFYSYAKKKEYEKVFYFALVYKQNTLIITAPKEKEKQHEFLGYKWSNRSGFEGIQHLSLGGKLFNDAKRNATDTLASAIRQSFLNQEITLNESNMAYSRIAPTATLFDYSRVAFNKSITTVDKHIVFESKYPLVPLWKKGEILKGTSITENKTKPGNIKVVAGGKSFAYYHNTSNRNKNIITISASGANAGFVNYWGEPIFASDCTTVQGKDNTETIFIYNYLKYLQEQIYLRLQEGSGQPHVYPDDIKMIPIPDINRQLLELIVEECIVADNNYKKITNELSKYRSEIDKIILDSKPKFGVGQKYRLDDKEKFDVSIGQRVLNKELIKNAEIPVFSANVFEPFGYTNKLLIEDFSVDSILWGIDGDWMVNYYEKDQPFYPTDHCGVLRLLTDEVNPRYMAYILEVEGKKLGFSRSFRASIDRIEGISFTVPSITVQNESMTKVKRLEKKVKELLEERSNVDNEKMKIIEKYLK